SKMVCDGDRCADLTRGAVRTRHRTRSECFRSQLGCSGSATIRRGDRSTAPLDFSEGLDTAWCVMHRLHSVTLSGQSFHVPASKPPGLLTQTIRWSHCGSGEGMKSSTTGISRGGSGPAPASALTPALESASRRARLVPFAAAFVVVAGAMAGTVITTGSAQA